VVLTDGNIVLAKQAASVAASDARHMSASTIERVRRREQRVYARANLVVALSKRVAESVIADFGVPVERVKIMYAGPNIEVDRIPEVGPPRLDGQPTILFVGRQFQRKGGDLLFSAFAKVRERVPDAKLVLIGPRGLSDLPAGVESLGLVDKSTVGGWAKIVAAYTNARVFCLPSRYEGFAISVLEAMLFARPCVTLSFPWMRSEMVEDGVTGFVIQGENEAQLVDRLVELLVDPAKAGAMGQAGRRAVMDRFLWSHSIQRLDDALLAMETGLHRPVSNP
jgi:glycosyltransferase involved in cell wall biosynthesis